MGLLGQARPVYTVVTTRTLPASAPQRLQLSALPKLAPLEERAAIQLLRQRCPNLMEGDAALVAAVCEHNALLLNLMGGFLGAGRCTVHHPDKASCPCCSVRGGRVLLCTLCTAAKAHAAKGRRAATTPPPPALQGIARMGIRQPRSGENRPGGPAGTTLVAKVADFLGQHLEDSELDVLARLSVWQSFTADLVDGGGAAGCKPAVLDDLQQLSVLRLAGGRYGLHPLVREAAQARLRSRQGLMREAQRWLVEQMAQMGRRLKQEPTHSMAATRERLVAEAPNVQRLCIVLQRAITDNAVGDGVVFDWLGGLQRLGLAMLDCRLCVDAEAVFSEVRHAPTLFLRALCF